MVAPTTPPLTTTTIEVDTVAADILRRADAHARANGETLGSYLEHTLPRNIVDDTPRYSPEEQKEAWDNFVREMTALVEASVPPGHVADDSRDSIYD